MVGKTLAVTSALKAALPVPVMMWCIGKWKQVSRVQERAGPEPPPWRKPRDKAQQRSRRPLGTDKIVEIQSECMAVCGAMAANMGKDYSGFLKEFLKNTKDSLRKY